MRVGSDPARWAISMTGIEYFESLDSNKAKNRSLTEYYRMTDSPTMSDSALIVGWYLEAVEGMDDFTSSEVTERAREARIRLGANVSRDLSKQVESANLMQVSERDGKTAYQLTLTGEDYVEKELVELK